MVLKGDASFLSPNAMKQRGWSLTIGHVEYKKVDLHRQGQSTRQHNDSVSAIHVKLKRL